MWKQVSQCSGSLDLVLQEKLQEFSPSRWCSDRWSSRQYWSSVRVTADHTPGPVTNLRPSPTEMLSSGMTAVITGLWQKYGDGAALMDWLLVDWQQPNSDWVGAAAGVRLLLAVPLAKQDWLYCPHLLPRVTADACDTCGPGHPAPRWEAAWFWNPKAQLREKVVEEPESSFIHFFR